MLTMQKQEIAAAAARMIAEEGLDYGSAKRKAFALLTGGRDARTHRQALPSNEDLEEALRDYQQLYQSDSQPARLRALRQKALALMILLRDFSPTVTGAIANGTAGEFSDIHLHCFADNAKDLGIFLLNQGMAVDADTLPHAQSGREAVEALAIQWQGELAVIAVYPHTDMRGAMKPNAQGRLQRLDIKSLQNLLVDEPS
jgi:hypothetical protein